MRATLMRPAAMAAAACSTWMTKEEPPTEVLSVYVGWMPRYSATWRLGLQPGPDVNRPSTSDMGMPASSRALRAASAWCWSVDLCGTIPISSDSSAPTMATFLKSAAFSLSVNVCLGIRPPGSVCFLEVGHRRTAGLHERARLDSEHGHGR